MPYGSAIIVFCGTENKPLLDFNECFVLLLLVVLHRRRWLVVYALPSSPQVHQVRSDWWETNKDRAGTLARPSSCRPRQQHWSVTGSGASAWWLLVCFLLCLYIFWQPFSPSVYVGCLQICYHSQKISMFRPTGDSKLPIGVSRVNSVCLCTLASHSGYKTFKIMN